MTNKKVNVSQSFISSLIGIIRIFSIKSYSEENYQKEKEKVREE